MATAEERQLGMSSTVPKPEGDRSLITSIATVGTASVRYNLGSAESGKQSNLVRRSTTLAA